MTDPTPDPIHLLAEGRLSAFAGLTPACTRAVVEAVLGPSAAGPDGSDQLDGAWVGFRDYPDATTVWFADNVAVLVRMVGPEIDRAEVAALGPPELTRDSGIAPMHSQDAWPSRGLTLHVHNVTGRVATLYAYPPTTPDEYERSSLAGASVHRQERHPR